MSKTVSKDLIKELVDAPFGKAEQILRDKGFWDESRVPKSERGVKEYEVILEAMQPVSATVTVFAKNEDEARILARAEVSSCDWEDDHFCDVEDVQIFEVSEVE